MRDAVRHLIDRKRGRANTRTTWTKCGVAARSCFVSAYLKNVTCLACFRALGVKHPDALCDCGHARRYHTGGRGGCSQCAVRHNMGTGRDCDRFKFEERELLLKARKRVTV
jgi:hypothetical protein